MSADRNEKLRLFPLQAGFALLIVAGPCFFGAVDAWASMFLASAIFLLFFLYPECILKVDDCPRVFLVGIGLIFLLVFFQAFITSMNPYATRTEFLKGSAWAAGFLLIQLFPPSPLVFFMCLLAILGAFESAYGLFQVSSKLEKVLWEAKTAHLGFVTGTYFNRNHLAGLLELCLGVHLGLWFSAFRSRHRLSILGWGLLFLVSFLGFLKTGSRMGIVSFALSFLFFSSLYLFGRERKAFLLFLVCVLSVISIVSWFGMGVMALRFEAFARHWITWEGRLFVWQDTLAMIREHFWWGTGLGTFEWSFPAYQSERLFRGWAHAHNDYLELAAELGIPGFLLLFFSGAYLFLNLIKQWLSSNGYESGLVWGGFVGAGALLLHGFTDFNFAVPANAMMFIFVLALITGLLKQSRTGIAEANG